MKTGGQRLCCLYDDVFTGFMAGNPPFVTETATDNETDSANRNAQMIDRKKKHAIHPKNNRFM
jgi:hypothetical protein